MTQKTLPKTVFKMAVSLARKYTHKNDVCVTHVRIDFKNTD